MKVYQIRQKNSNQLGLIVFDLHDAADCLGGIENEEIGNEYEINVIAMSKIKFDKLPEWDGF